MVFMSCRVGGTCQLWVPPHASSVNMSETRSAFREKGCPIDLKVVYLFDYQTIKYMDNLYASYQKILNVLKATEPKSHFLRQIRKPKLSDIELIALSLTAEYLGIDSEHDLFRKIPPSISAKIERSVYNRRRRRLFEVTETLRVQLSESMSEHERFHIIDSMPLEVCRLSRSSSAKVCREHYQTSPNKGWCAAQKMYYYGYKIHAVCTLKGVFGCFDLSKASVHDIAFLGDIKDRYPDTVILGDKAYLSQGYQRALFEQHNIRLEVSKRVNQADYQKTPSLIRKCRKRIETLFSQLCDQFMIRRNYAKTFEGFKTRILAKITSLTVIQFINKQLNRNINNLKIKIA